MNSIILLLCPALLISAALSDLLSMRIPNWIPLTLLLVFAVACLAVGLDLAALVNHLSAGLIAFAIGFCFFALGWIGGGDAKLSAVIALWFGLDQSLTDFVLISALAGGLLTAAVLVGRQIPLPRVAQSWSWLQRLHDKGSGIPYGIALAVAALTAFWSSPLALQLQAK